MSIENNTNQQAENDVQKPDPRFVLGLLGVIVLCLLAYLSKPNYAAGERKTVKINNVEFAFRWCPAGTFIMGSPKSDEWHRDDETQHKVMLSQGFWMLETEVTQKQWKAIMGKNQSRFNGGDLPVEKVSWDDCNNFCKKCADLGFLFQLPTEAQWEYACRAGTKSAYAGDLNAMAWHLSNCDRKSHPVGKKKPNAWGLYDMHGNVSEWCQDSYSKDYPKGSVTNPIVDSKDPRRVRRGGSWGDSDASCRSAYRSGVDFNCRVDNLGFRFIIYKNPSSVQHVGSTSKAKSSDKAAGRIATPQPRRSYKLLIICGIAALLILAGVLFKYRSRIVLFFKAISASTNTDPNEQREDKPQLPDPKFVFGLIVFITLCSIAYLIHLDLGPGSRRVVKINNVEFAFRWCPAGTFMMGSPISETGHVDDETLHEVKLTCGFWMLETEVTQKQWKAIMGKNPSRFNESDDLPVDKISWNDCQNFCKKCAKLGFPVQLPTETLWEYACRAGSEGPYAGDINEMTWYIANSNHQSKTVGTKKPNAWGLYDMHGNVSEWCQDSYSKDYPIGSVTEPMAASKGENRVYRGGNWGLNAGECRSAKRQKASPDYSYSDLGFRCIINRL